MEVYEFEKSLSQRFNDTKMVLLAGTREVPSSMVRAKWSYYVEEHVEPTGWNALWRLPRALCEEMNMRYPTIVHGRVEDVKFRRLKAKFRILAIEDEDVELDEVEEAHLEDLWPTKAQEYLELNTKRTAECIDNLRFFYTNIWMPWDYDNDDDIDWPSKYLQSRMRFYYELKTAGMKKAMLVHIKSLLAEARYIQHRRDLFEVDLIDDDDSGNGLENSQVSDLMRLHLRLTMIKSEVELLMNTQLRKIYEDVEFEDYKVTLNGIETLTDKVNIFIVTKPHKLEKQIEFLEIAKSIIDGDKTVQMCLTLKEALKACKPSDEILLTPGYHPIKFLEHLNNGKLVGLRTNDTVEEICIAPDDEDANLFTFDGDYELENLTLDCCKIRTALLIKSGTIRLKNCTLKSSNSRPSSRAIIAVGNSKVILDNCTIHNISSGIELCDNASLELINTSITVCRIGLELQDSNLVTFTESTIITTHGYGIWFETEQLKDEITEKRTTYKSAVELQENYATALPWSGTPVFGNNNKGNILIINIKRSLFPKLNNSWTVNNSAGFDLSEPMDESNIIVIDDSSADEM